MQMSKWRIKKFVLDVWNFLDLTTLGLLLAWGILLGYESAFTAARMVLGLAAIPLAVSLLQYLSIQQDLGELVLIIINMCNDIRIFFLVYMICITGYGIAFLGFYYGFDGYKDIADAYLTLFSASMGNFDYEEFRENSGAVSVYGIAVLTTFLVLTSILLLNLLIARLSSTYNMISERSIEEFSYIKAKNVKKYLRHSEASPLCMLPPPLNAIPTVVWVTGMHGFMMEKFRVSICGAISDLLLEILFFPLSFVYNFFHTLRRFDNKVKESLRSQKVFSVVAYEIGALLLVAVPYNIFVLPVYQFALNVADCVLNPTRVDVPAEKATINYYGLDTFGRDSWGKDSIERFSENWRVSIGRNSMDRSSVTGRDRGASTGSQGERPSEGHRQRATRKKTKAEQFIGYVSGGVYKLASFFFYSRRRIIYDQGRLEEAAAGTEAAAAGNRDVHADDNKMCPLESMNLMVNATRPGYFLKGDIARLLDLLRLDDYNVNVDEAESTKAPASESRGNATDKASAGVDLKENEVTDLQTENAQLEMKLSSLTSEIHEVKSEMASLRSDVSKMLEILGRGK
jgi:fumarate reductase subunit D